MATIVVAASDLHIGSTVGLCPPNVALDDGGTYKPSKAQRWLWRCWQRAWQRVDELRSLPDGGKMPLWIVLNGDIIDGDHHQSYQILPRNPERQIELAIQTLDPVVQQAEHLFVVRGTSAHVGKSAWMEEKIAEDLGAEPDTATGNASWWHLRFICEAVKFDVAHHANGGNLPWTFANIANRLAAQTLIEYMLSNERPPDIVLRSHKHKFKDSGLNYPVRAFGLPAWQLATEYVSRIAPGQLADIGMLAFIIDGQDYKVEPILFTPKRTPLWTKRRSRSTR